MGLDFSALLKTPTLLKASGNVLDALERMSPPEVREVSRFWGYAGFATLPEPLQPVWVNNFGVQEVVSRPMLPSLEVSLKTSEGFYLTFGSDAVRIYHILRWRIFLTDIQWQRLMLNACRAFARELGAVDGIVTSDWSPVIDAFFRGLRFEEALAEGKGKDGEVAYLTDLYVEDVDGTWDSNGYWRFLTKQ
jgi:hypothetical protein